MFSNTVEFKETFLKRIEMVCGKSFSDSSARDHYQTLGTMISEFVSGDWITTNEKHLASKGKQVYISPLNIYWGNYLDKI